ncbi:DEAD/DEAH box helicase [Acanthopleuribacter pedis]|uniref:DEAD/DEAH box helicase n=1 Tax=Acanthopleuribacter pedis TaxID=442870 RepID=A0A8J7Q512_9BACT|nr:DEAD/DEAH box helicase [Acanthopleuribacter pedis]
MNPLLAGDRDVVISAATASGKTEAAFLPICSRLAEEPAEGIGVLYISPLKALITDQHRRLESLCEHVGLQITPWHGDVPKSLKTKLRRRPRGILLITPESLESLLIHQMGWLKTAFAPLRYIVIDEFHAFIGSERGCQLLSLLTRLGFLLDKEVPRVALSATLGDLVMVGKCLRPAEAGCEPAVIESAALKSSLKIQLRGYLIPDRPHDEDDNPVDTVQNQIVADLFSILRGKSHLVFANSRRWTEYFAAELADRCAVHALPNEFFPHHGNLAKELREQLEARLLEGRLPTTAVCTMTLELGIDIGSVDSVAQVAAPHSVASLRQRLGRSGRRGEAAVLRLFIKEQEVTADSGAADRLRFHTMRCAALISLLLKKWYEPPLTGLNHFSTLVHQVLAVIGQYGGARADQLHRLLCARGPFQETEPAAFAALLRSMGEDELISQTHDGQLVLGVKGENLVGHYSFFSVFKTPEEYRLEAGGKVLGTVPVDGPLLVDQIIIFAGKRWRIESVDDEKKVITLTKAKGGSPPLFLGDPLLVHDRVRQEMFALFESGECPVYFDAVARDHFEEAVSGFREWELADRPWLVSGANLWVFPWLGDRVVNALAILVTEQGFQAGNDDGILEVRNCSEAAFKQAIKTHLAGPRLTKKDLAARLEGSPIEKYDKWVPKSLRQQSQSGHFFDLEGAYQWLERKTDFLR